jgi:hypothetical protein
MGGTIIAILLLTFRGQIPNMIFTRIEIIVEHHT